jgi:thymidylate synthase (FAD)
MDKHFCVVTLASTDEPQTLVWKAMHQCYFEGFVGNCTYPPTEADAGAKVIKHLLAGGKGHFGPLEHPQITFAVGGFPHSVMQQARTHRIGCCLSGDTVVEFGHPATGSEGQTYYRSTIAHLARLWHNGRSHQQTENDALYMQRQINSRNLLHLNEETGFIAHTHISNIYLNGPKGVWLFTLEDGKSIKATKDHKVLTPNGWTTFGQLSIGCEVLTVAACGSFSAPIEAHVAAEDAEEWKPCVNFPAYEVSTHGGVRSWAPRKHRRKLVYPPAPRPKRPSRGAAGCYLYVSLADGNGRSVRKNVHSLVLEAFSGTRPEGKVARHLNGNHLDNRLSNLMWGSQAENAADRMSHGVTPRKKGVARKITSIEFAGIEETYDLEVVGPHHNFIANGIVVHNSFDVQSGRYTGKRVLDLFASGRPSYPELEEVFYIRPEGDYNDRQGKKYTFSEVDRQRYLDATLASAEAFNRFITHGHAEEHARELLPYSVRQNFVVSSNLRSLMHFLDLRAKLDAQLEIRQLCDLLMVEFTRWTPDIAVWYLENRWAKARLAP